MSLSGRRVLKAAAAACRGVTLPPGVVIAYVLLIAVLGLLHGREAVLHPGQPVTAVRGVTPVDLREVGAVPFAGFLQNAYTNAIAATGRTAAWLRLAAAGEAHRRALQTSQDLPSLQMNDGEYKVWWALTDALGAQVDMAAVDAAARGWLGGDSTVARIPSPVNIRFAWFVNTTQASAAGFDGVWGGFGFGTGMAGGDLLCTRVHLNATDLTVTQSTASDTDPTQTGPPRHDAQEDVFDFAGGGYLDPAALPTLLHNTAPAVLPAGATPTPGAARTALTLSYTRPLNTGDPVDHVVSPPPYLQAYFDWVASGTPAPAGIEIAPVYEDVVIAYHPSTWRTVHHGSTRRARLQANMWAASADAVQPVRNTTLPALSVLGGYTLSWDFAGADGTAVDMDVVGPAATTLLQTKSDEGLPSILAPAFIRYNFRVRISGSLPGNGEWNGWWAALGFGTQMVGSDIHLVQMQISPSTGQVLAGFPVAVDAQATSLAQPDQDADQSDISIVSGGYIDLDSVTLAETLNTATPPVVQRPPTALDGGDHVLSVTMLRRLTPLDTTDVGIATPPHITYFFQHSAAVVAAGESVEVGSEEPPLRTLFQPMILAYRRDSSNIAYHGLDGRARANVNLFASAGQDVIEPGSLDTSLELGLTYVVHGVTMGLAWAVVTPISIIILHYSGGRKSFAIDLHHALMNVVGTITIPTAASAFAATDAEGREVTTHGYIGVTIAGLTMVQIGLGQAAKSYYTSTTTPAWALRRFKQAHILIGLAMFPTAMANAYLGVEFFSAGPDEGDRILVPILWYTLLCLTVLGLELRVQWAEAAASRNFSGASNLADLERALRRAKSGGLVKDGETVQPNTKHLRASKLSAAGAARVVSTLAKKQSLARSSLHNGPGGSVLSSIAAAPPTSSNSVLLGQAMFGTLRRTHTAGGDMLPLSASGDKLVGAARPGSPRELAPRIVALSPPASMFTQYLQKVQDGEMSAQEAGEQVAAALAVWNTATLEAGKLGEAGAVASPSHIAPESKFQPPPIRAYVTPPLDTEESVEGEAVGVDEDADTEDRLFTEDGVPVVTVEEFAQQVSTFGEKLTLIGGAVYDVGEFAQQHPGSAYVITKAIGKDVTGQFIGVDTVDPRIPRHSHSSRARVLLSGMLVAVLDTSQAGRMAQAKESGHTLTPVAESIDDTESVVSTTRQPAWWQVWCCAPRRVGPSTSSPPSASASVDMTMESGLRTNTPLGVSRRLQPERRASTEMGTPVPQGRGFPFNSRRLSSASVSGEEIGSATPHASAPPMEWTLQERHRVAPPTSGLTPTQAAAHACTDDALATMRPVVAFLTCPEDQSDRAAPLSNWNSFGQHMFVLLPKNITVDDGTGQLTDHSAASARDDMDDLLALRRAFTVVRLPATFAKHVAGLGEEGLAEWRQALSNPTAGMLKPTGLQMWARRFPAPMGATARFLHDFVGPARGGVRMAGPAGDALPLLRAIGSVAPQASAEEDTALLVAVCGGTGVTPFLDVVFALLVAGSPAGRDAMPALPSRVHLHLTLVAPTPAAAVAVPFFALAAATSAGRTSGHTVSVHLHFTKLSAPPSLQELQLPPSLAAELQQHTVCGRGTSTGTPWLRLTCGSIRAAPAAREVLAASLIGAGQTVTARAPGATPHSRLGAVWVCGPPTIYDSMSTALYGDLTGHTGDHEVPDSAVKSWVQAESAGALSDVLTAEKVLMAESRLHMLES